MPAPATKRVPRVPRDTVVVVVSVSGRKTPFGPARPACDAVGVARKLRSWGLDAHALPGSVVAGRFLPAEDASSITEDKQ